MDGRQGIRIHHAGRRGQGRPSTGSGRGKDIFVHHSEIQMSGRRSLSEGQKVEFDVEQSDKGPKAVGVKVIG